MPRGRGRPPKAKRGRPRLSGPIEGPSTPQHGDGPPPAKRKRGRPSSGPNMGKRQQKDEPQDIEDEELSQLRQQVLDEAGGSSGDNNSPLPVVKQVRRSAGRPRKSVPITDEEEEDEEEQQQQQEEEEDDVNVSQIPIIDEEQSCGLHMTTMQIKALSNLVACKDCGERITLSVRPTTKGMISEFVVGCTVCEAKKVTITPNLVRERKRKKEIKGLMLQKTENINYAHVAAYLDNGLGYSGLRHYCKYFNARCLNEATFIVYARQVIQDVVNDTEDNLQSNARIVRKVYDAGLDEILDITVSYTTTYHQWGSDFCLVAGAVIELQTGLVLDYDVANMYCHVCKINAKRIISMTPTEMTDWFNKHQNNCEIREWCDELDHDAEEGVKDIEPKYLECFVAKKIWSRSMEKFGFRYSTLIHESDETIHNELLRAAPYGDTLVMIDNLTNCFSRRKSEHARTAFQNKLKSKCPRERVQTKDRIMYVYAMSIPEYNRFAVGSNIKLRELVRRMEIEESESEGFTLQVLDTIPTIQAHEVIPADGETSEVVYTHVQDQEGEPGEEEMYEIDGEVPEEEEEEEDEEMEEGEEESKVEKASNSKQNKQEVKRENIVCEAVEDDESADYEEQTSVGDAEEEETAASSNGTNTNNLKEIPHSSSSSSQASQIIVVTENNSSISPGDIVSTAVVTAVSSGVPMASTVASNYNKTPSISKTSNGLPSQSESPHKK